MIHYNDYVKIKNPTSVEELGIGIVRSIFYDDITDIQFANVQMFNKHKKGIIIPVEDLDIAEQDSIMETLATHTDDDEKEDSHNDKLKLLTEDNPAIYEKGQLTELLNFLIINYGEVTTESVSRGLNIVQIAIEIIKAYENRLPNIN